MSFPGRLVCDQVRAEPEWVIEGLRSVMFACHDDGNIRSELGTQCRSRPSMGDEVQIHQTGP